MQQPLGLVGLKQADDTALAPLAALPAPRRRRGGRPWRGSRRRDPNFAAFKLAAPRALTACLATQCNETTPTRQRKRNAAASPFHSIPSFLLQLSIWAATSCHWLPAGCCCHHLRCSNNHDRSITMTVSSTAEKSRKVTSECNVRRFITRKKKYSGMVEKIY